MLRLASPVAAIRGVGAAIGAQLAREGVETVAHLLWRLPYRYEDRARLRPISSLSAADGVVTVAGRVVEIAEQRARGRTLRIARAVVEDETGAIVVVWFNQPYLLSTLRPGRRVFLHGPLKAGWRGALELSAPEWEAEDEDADPLHVGRIVPIYSRIGELSGRRVRALVARCLEQLVEVGETDLDRAPGALGLPSFDRALRDAHFPPADDRTGLDELAARLSPAHRRLAYAELLAFAAAVERERAVRRGQRALACAVAPAVREKARALLPFALTGAQRRVLGEIVADLQREHPMARLLQGDVGSGKTIVAALAALVAACSGAQVALLAPTEVLSQQHHATLSRLLAPAGVRVDLLIGSLSAAGKRAARAQLVAGEAGVVVGTHALIQDEVVFARLGLAIIDEQHRFGVAQRQALLDKGSSPHLLVMTATPIPRSLALTLYGDLDVSVLDEMPPGRTPVRTVVRGEEVRGGLLESVRREVGEGGRVFWVFPLIEASAAVSRRALEAHLRAVRSSLEGVAVGAVHGRMPAAEREEAMAAFARGDVAVLCATTVIEVGVDVPEASVIVVENAESFGLAQLHQLRGRVGRGARRGVCVLLAGARCSAEARARLDLLASTTDGFAIAEEDFRVRGPGELTGRRQWGKPELRVASLARHLDELHAARATAADAAAAGRLAELDARLAALSLAPRAIPTG